MIKRMFFSIILVSLLIVVQSTWLDAIAFYSVVPDLALLAVVYISFRSPNIEGQVLGFIVGLLQDGISSGIFGLNAFIKTAIAWTANSISGKFNIDRLIMPVVFGFVATLLKAIYISILSFFFKDRIIAYNFLDKFIWIEAAYNALVAPILFFLLSLLDRFLIKTERRG